MCKHDAKSSTIAWSWTARDPVQVCPIFPCPWKGDRALRSSKGETRKTWMPSSHDRVHCQGCPAMQHRRQGTWTQTPSPSVQATYNPQLLSLLPLFQQRKFFSLIGLLHVDTAFSNLFRKMLEAVVNNMWVFLLLFLCLVWSTLLQNKKYEKNKQSPITRQESTHELAWLYNINFASFETTRKVLETCNSITTIILEYFRVFFKITYYLKYIKVFF